MTDAYQKCHKHAVKHVRDTQRGGRTGTGLALVRVLSGRLANGKEIRGRGGKEWEELEEGRIGPAKGAGVTAAPATTSQIPSGARWPNTILLGSAPAQTLIVAGCGLPEGRE